MLDAGHSARMTAGFCRPWSEPRRDGTLVADVVVGGCAAQGFEYDWNGVVFGPDLVYRDGRLVTDRAAGRDPALRRGVADADADRLIRNTYKVLPTRGMVGTLVYSVDPATQEFLAGLLGLSRGTPR